MDNLPHPPGPGRLKWYGHTDKGRVRPHNEDCFLARQINAQEVHHLGKIGEDLTGSSDFVFAVSDGMGGALAGEFASRITVEKITGLLPRYFRQAAQGVEIGYGDILEELFDQIHRALTFVGGSYEECLGMQATLSLGWFTPTQMHFGHIGDSRIYYLPAAERAIKQLTHDDTHVGWLFRTGQINEREAREHPRRHALQKALGAGNQFIEPQVGVVHHARGDLFLFCSDGLTEGFFEYEILDLLRPLEPDATRAPNPAQFLVETSLRKNGSDNLTALVVEVA